MAIGAEVRPTAPGVRGAVESLNPQPENNMLWFFFRSNMLVVVPDLDGALDVHASSNFPAFVDKQRIFVGTERGMVYRDGRNSLPGWVLSRR